MQKARIVLQGGFTLVELIITLVLLGILSALGSSMIVDVFKTTRLVNEGQSSADEARYALERLAREIREVKYVPGVAPAPPTAGNYSITTFFDPGVPDPMVFTNGADVTVTIARAGNSITLGYSSTQVTSVLARQVTAFSLSYLTADGVTTTNNTNLVRFVKISLTVADGLSGQMTTQQTRVVLRNA